MECYLRIILFKFVEKNLVDWGVQEIDIFLVCLIRYVDIGIVEENSFFYVVIICIYIVYVNGFYKGYFGVVFIYGVFDDDCGVCGWYLKVEYIMFECLVRNLEIVISIFF